MGQILEEEAGLAGAPHHQGSALENVTVQLRSGLDGVVEVVHFEESEVLGLVEEDVGDLVARHRVRFGSIFIFVLISYISGAQV